MMRAKGEGDRQGGRAVDIRSIGHVGPKWSFFSEAFGCESANCLDHTPPHWSLFEIFDVTTIMDLI